MSTTFADRSVALQSSSSGRIRRARAAPGTSYTGTGNLVSAGAFTNSAPDSHAIITIKGSGHWVRGTGVYKHVSGKFTVSGTLDTTNGHLKVVLVGTQTY